MIVMLGAVSLARADPSSGYGHMDGWGNGGVAMMFGPILWLIVLGVIVFAIVHYLQRSDIGNKSPDAMEKLRMRLANGEIEPDEFESRRKLLDG